MVEGDSIEGGCGSGPGPAANASQPAGSASKQAPALFPSYPWGQLSLLMDPMHMVRVVGRGERRWPGHSRWAPCMYILCAADSACEPPPPPTPKQQHSSDKCHAIASTVWCDVQSVRSSLSCPAATHSWIGAPLPGPGCAAALAPPC